MIERNAAPALRRLATQYPVLTVTGPRQSGKTTLCRALFPNHPYVNLEPIDTRDEVRRDPRGFLAAHAKGAVVDEVQHVPELLSYLQAEVDVDPTRGRFILTGSQHFGLSEQVAQSLAGRTAVFQLLPLSLDEIRRFDGASLDLMTTLWTGAYPRIFDRGIEPSRWYADYTTTYIQRNVRQLLNVSNLEAFTTFLRLCAGRSSQELVLSSLGADAGVSQPTARAWLSVLETSFLCHRVSPWHRNFRKQTVKAPKLHFLDTGLVCFLLGIGSPDQLRSHPLRGAIFETWVASEIYKARANAGQTVRLAHYRQARGPEVDLLVEASRALFLVEAKSGATVAADFFAGLDGLAALIARAEPHRTTERVLVYGGDEPRKHQQVSVVPWSRLPDVRWCD
ncbi:MAG: ATP-binding protein [Polyangiaceae bacterium]|nr:ATP-binding protein [Polyangiaceae bacterium]